MPYIFRVEQLAYSEIKHSDWLNIDMGLGTAKESALCQHNVAILH